MLAARADGSFQQKNPRLTGNRGFCGNLQLWLEVPSRDAGIAMALGHLSSGDSLVAQAHFNHCCHLLTALINTIGGVVSKTFAGFLFDEPSGRCYKRLRISGDGFELNTPSELVIKLAGATIEER